ncbi:auxilin-like protein 1 [Cynara cardunculus var. scolymus]|uniref:J domain-containing protein n=1 Tax=Cynara cardunculus var. scolymus TaxID=59895 RepID=A0A103YCF4_CYNCS|nr:auxilin-like protein 1 [Cynara cardunculus var. scolymus]KVI06547.1 hypothetical protein Ccrd_015107 [Cynara cardunculus var. scolymus]
MESLSRPLHRRKLSNANTFSAKNAYDGVFSSHRPNYDRPPAVNLEEYSEIFSSGQAASSIPVLDLSTLQDSSDATNLELGSTKPDYGKIFGGFRDQDIAVSYEELFARNKARAPSSTSQSSQELGDPAHQSSDALKQFNMSYNKISQRSKDGLDGKTHVTQLHAVPGFTFFIDEAASQPKKETEKQKSSVTNNIHLSVNSSKGDFLEKETSRSAVGSRSKYGQDESLSDDRKFKTAQTDFKSHPFKASSSPAASATNVEAASQPKEETVKQKSSVTNNVLPGVNSSNGDFPEKETSRSAVGYRSKYCQDESLSDDRYSKTVQTNLKSHPSKASSSPSASATDDEAAFQPKEETVKQKSSLTNNVLPGVNSSKGDFPEKETSRSAVGSRSKYCQDESLSDDRNSKTVQTNLKSHPSKASSSPSASATDDEAAFQPKEETVKQKSSVTNDVLPSVNTSKGDFPEKETSGSAVECRSKSHEVESLSNDGISKTFQADIKLHPSKVSSSPAASATDVNHKDYQRRSTAANTGTCKSDTPMDFFPTCFAEELDVNSAAAASAAALRKAIEKAQESIRIAKESVGRKKEGLRSFSSKSFKDSLKVKTRVANVSMGEDQKDRDSKIKETFERIGAASQVSSNVGRNNKYGGTVVFPDIADGEKLFGAKKVIDEMHGKISESAKNSEIPIRSSYELIDNKIVCNSKEVAGETEAVDLGSAGNYENSAEYSEAVESNTCEAPQKDIWRPNGFLVLESYEKKLGDIEDTVTDDKPSELKENNYEARPSNAHKLVEGLNNLALYQKVEDEKKISQGSDQNGYEKRFSEALELLENKKQGLLEHEHNEKVANAERYEPNSVDETSEKVLEDERELKEDSGLGSLKEEDTSEKFYDVSELEMIENAQMYANSLGKNEVSPKEDCEMKEKESHKGEEAWKKLDKVHELEIYENSSSDYDDAEGSESMHGCNGLSQEDCKVGQSDNNVGSSQEVDEASSSSAEVIGAFYEVHVEDTEAIELQYISEEKEIFEKISVDHTASEYNEDECEAKSDSLSDCILADMHVGQDETEQIDTQSESSSDMIHGMEIEVNEYKEREETIEEETIVSVEEKESSLQQSHEGRPEIGIKMETGTSQEPKVSTEMEGTMDMNENIITSHCREKKDETRESGPSKMVEKERYKKIEGVTAEERERERNRLAVERAIREARERAFAEARERAERAAVERATAEVRQRVMADAQEKVAKASVGIKSSDKTSAQSKLRAERAAVERATSEARQRALEKAMSQNKTSEPRAQANETGQTSFSDIHISNGGSAESAQRTKAKLEKHNRIMERAAKALEEKEKRDLLAQKEQAERSRLAENLDADIKRWSSGKEGNLRALLSTLQYILGADSGWQPISLTEIITSSAVKKAYRKATLCVHPDKLQQRGASIQQKYICEKVFDLLKAAWNRFNSEER